MGWKKSGRGKRNLSEVFHRGEYGASTGGSRIRQRREGSYYTPVGDPMPLCQRLVLFRESVGIEPEELVMELGLFDKHYPAALKEAKFEAAFDVLDGEIDMDSIEEDAEEIAMDKALEELDQYESGDKWIPNGLFNDWLDYLKSMK